ncbi:MAG TPA: hypothetical protein VF331_05890 [Polyangiales bacterium]
MTRRTTLILLGSLFLGACPVGHKAGAPNASAAGQGGAAKDAGIRVDGGPLKQDAGILTACSSPDDCIGPDCYRAQ